MGDFDLQNDRESNNEKNFFNLIGSFELRSNGSESFFLRYSINLNYPQFFNYALPCA